MNLLAIDPNEQVTPSQFASDKGLLPASVSSVTDEPDMMGVIDVGLIPPPPMFGGDDGDEEDDRGVHHTVSMMGEQIMSPVMDDQITGKAKSRLYLVPINFVPFCQNCQQRQL